MQERILGAIIRARWRKDWGSTMPLVGVTSDGTRALGRKEMWKSRFRFFGCRRKRRAWISDVNGEKWSR